MKLVKSLVLGLVCFQLAAIADNSYVSVGKNFGIQQVVNQDEDLFKLLQDIFNLDDIDIEESEPEEVSQSVLNQNPKDDVFQEVVPVVHQDIQNQETEESVDQETLDFLDMLFDVLDNGVDTNEDIETTTNYTDELSVFVDSHIGECIDIENIGVCNSVGVTNEYINTLIDYEYGQNWQLILQNSYDFFKSVGSFTIRTDTGYIEFEKIERNNTNKPQRGDIVVWNQNFGSGDHMGIVLEANDNNFLSFDQDSPQDNSYNSEVNVHAYDYRDVAGWYRIVSTQ